MKRSRSQVRKVTPPEKTLKAPLTPPPSDSDTKPSDTVRKILETLKEYENGTLSEVPWRIIRLQSQEYEELLDQLKRDELLGGFVDDKVRYDYNPIKAQFIIRMPTLTHNTFALDLDKEIEKRLHSLADTEPDTRAFIKKIKSVSGKIEIPILDEGQQPDAGHEPDIMFKQKDAIWPGVVIEVANSQKKKSLPDLADDYILGTYGGINVVVGLDLDYMKSKKASFSIWRLKKSINDDGEVEGEVVQVVDDQLFRDAQGNPVPSQTSSLRLALKDFGCQGIDDNIPNVSVIIDAETLCELLGEAEAQYKIVKTKQGPKPQAFKRKRREATPPEGLTLSDEEKVKEAERRVRRKTEKLDPSYGDEQVLVEESSQGSVQEMSVD